MESKLRAVGGFVVLGVVLGLVGSGASGCAAGGGAAGARFPEEPAPTTVEEAQSQLAQAREQIEGPAPAGASTTPTPVAGGGAAPAAPPATMSAESAAEPAEQTKSSAPPDACALPCHAIASMRRAVDAICRMAGPQDSRCVTARKTLSDDEGRVAPCGC